MIFSVRQIQEKCVEKNPNLYQCFIDLPKAFDTVNRAMLWKVLKKFGCPDKFVMKATVNFNGGVKQGDILAPTMFALYFTALFMIAFKGNTKEIYLRYRTDGKLFNIRRLLADTKVFIALVRELLYADDCNLVAHTEQDL